MEQIKSDGFESQDIEVEFGNDPQHVIGEKLENRWNKVKRLGRVEKENQTPPDTEH